MGSLNHFYSDVFCVHFHQCYVNDFYLKTICKRETYHVYKVPSFNFFQTDLSTFCEHLHYSLAHQSWKRKLVWELRSCQWRVLQFFISSVSQSNTLHYQCELLYQKVPIEIWSNQRLEIFINSKISKRSLWRTITWHGPMICLYFKSLFICYLLLSFASYPISYWNSWHDLCLLGREIRFTLKKQNSRGCWFNYCKVLHKHAFNCNDHLRISNIWNDIWDYNRMKNLWRRCLKLRCSQYSKHTWSMDGLYRCLICRSSNLINFTINKSRNQQGI